MAGRAGGSAASLIGRDAESDRVRQVIEAVQRGQSSTLLVAGVAGVGKTSLVRRAVDRAAADGALVLWGAGLPMAALASPFRTVRGMLRDLPDGVPAAPVGPGGHAGAVGVDPVELDDWVDRLARERPVVLVADDLQWVDHESLDVLRYIVAGARERAVAVVLTLRSEEVGVGHPLHGWLGHVRRLPGFEELDLAPLDRYATGELVTAVLGRRPHESLVDEVFRRSGGVPYLSRLLLSGLDPRARTLPEEAPAGLEDAVLASWHELSPGARELTTVLAVAGRGLERSDVAALVEGHLGADEVPRWLDEAVEHAVLDADSNGRYWFHHPLQAELLAAAAHPEDRRAWHERIALLIRSELEPDDAAVDAARVVAVADHYAAAGMADEAYVWSLLVAAGLEGRTSAGDAVRALRRALELRDAAGAVEPSGESLLARLRAATARAGDLWGELDAVERLLEVVDREERPEVVSEILVRRIHLRFLCRRQSDFRVSDAEEAVAVSARRPDSWQHALALSQLAQALESTQRADLYERAVTHSDAALRLAESTANTRALAHALAVAAFFPLHDGDLETARGLAARARAAAALSRDYWAFTFAVAMESNAEGYIHGIEIFRIMSRARAELVAMGAPHAWVATLSQDVARAAVTMGDVATARAMMRQALGADPGPNAEVGTRIAATRLAALTGLVHEANQHWARVEKLVSDHFRHYGDDTVHAELLLASDRPRQALDVCLEVLREGADFVTMGEWLLPLAARALADLGAGEDEVDQLEREFPPSTPDGSAPSPIPVDGVPDEPRYLALRQALEDWYRAELARARRATDGHRLWERAASAFDEVGLPWEAAYAWMRWGESLLRADRVDRRAAARALRGAADRAVPLEAAPVLDRVEALARSARIDLTAPKENVPTGGQPSLTRREREVLAHLEVGRTYAEIAGALYLSEKTVSSHVSNMLRKTGASNRHDLVARAREARDHPR